MLRVVMLSLITLNVTHKPLILSVVMLKFVMLNVIMHSVVAPIYDHNMLIESSIAIVIMFIIQATGFTISRVSQYMVVTMFKVHATYMTYAGLLTILRQQIKLCIKKTHTP